jgi:alpha/beta superfamily hydrolase
VDSRPLTVTGPAGTIEAAIDRAGDAEAQFICVVCHPHPLQQGTMQNKVVTTVSRAAARLGGHSLRFNYRGVGNSDGSYDGERGELDDALAAIAHLRADSSYSALPLVIAGFSFGGAIAYRAALEAEHAALVTVAPAWERIPGDAAEGLSRWLLLQGEDDDIIPAAGVLQWAEQHAQPPQVARFESTGHFFHGRLPGLADSVSAYLREALF